jgi:trk system potassium uptake protein TrkA
LRHICPLNANPEIQPVKIIIIGAGEVGFHIASHLTAEDKDVVVIDKDPEATRRVSDNLDVQVLVGSGSSPVTLEEAGIHGAEIILAVTDSDEVNLVSCLVADIVSPGTKKLARLRGENFDAYIEPLRQNAPHIDTVINPEIEVVKTIERMMMVPGAVDVGEFAEGRVKFIGVRLDEESPLIGKRMMDLPAILEGRRLLIAAMIRQEELIIPRGRDRLMAGDLVYFISDENPLAEIMTIFGKHSEPVHRVMIVGGGRIGLRLAHRLEGLGIHTKIVERRPERCQMLAEQLNKTVVLHGDGSDQALLTEENIQEIDLMVTLTNDEETNILSSLLAKRLGARKTITKINKFSYLPLMSAIGLDHVVSPRLSAINSILQHIRRGKILSAISLKNEQAEAMEAVALETSDIVGKPLRDINFPKGSLVTGIIRGQEVIIPTGESVIAPDDRIIIFARRDAIASIEKILAVKLEYF